MHVPTRNSADHAAHPGADELSARFQTPPDQGFARARSEQARSARGGLMAAGALVAVVCLFLIVGRVDGGGGMGLWTLAYGFGLGSAALGVESARRGRTRWALMAIIVGAVSASLGDALP
jgi:hypothetical protein